MSEDWRTGTETGRKGERQAWRRVMGWSRVRAVLPWGEGETQADHRRSTGTRCGKMSGFKICAATAAFIWVSVPAAAMLKSPSPAAGTRTDTAKPLSFNVLPRIAAQFSINLSKAPTREVFF